MENPTLVGCIQTLNDTIQTRFFYVNKAENDVRDVTLELCKRVDDFNETTKAIRETGEYAMTIPYEYKNGMAEYSFGCGLSHYLQENVFGDLVERSTTAFTFPLTDCRIAMYTPSDVKDILSCKGVFDKGIEGALRERYGFQETN